MLSGTNFNELYLNAAIQALKLWLIELHLTKEKKSIRKENTVYNYNTSGMLMILYNQTFLIIEIYRKYVLWK